MARWLRPTDWGVLFPFFNNPANFLCVVFSPEGTLALNNRAISNNLLCYEYPADKWDIWKGLVQCFEYLIKYYQSWECGHFGPQPVVATVSQQRYTSNYTHEASHQIIRTQPCTKSMLRVWTLCERQCYSVLSIQSF